MQRARLLSRTDVILPDNLPPALRQATRSARDKPELGDPDARDAQPQIRTLQDTEIASLREALASTNGNKTKAAELLGISRRGLLKKLKRFGL